MKLNNKNEKKAKLTIENITLKFGAISALNNVSFQVKKDELLAIIGPNGAGKTCILNCISGFYDPQEGEIHFNGLDLIKVPSYKRPKLGIARVFQGVQLYRGLTVLENILSGRHIFMKQGTIAGGLFFGKARRDEVEHRKVVEEIIDFLEIETIRKKKVEELPYGMRKRVDLGRALALNPSLLLLDEPMAGMNLEEKEDIARFILDVSEEKEIAIVMVEHDLGAVMDIADRIVAVDFGNKVAEGVPSEVTSNPDVIKAYIGDEKWSNGELEDK
ncbi:MAG: ABC transporter ATP-binding protein [bacterium]